MSIDKLKNRFVTGAWLTDVKHYFNKINEIIDNINNNPGYIPTYKVYSALVSQIGTSDPTAIILENTLGVIPTWGRTNVGDYFVQAIGKFTLDKTTISIGIPNFSLFISAPALPIVDQDTLRLVTKSALDVSTDSRLKKTFIEIRVYN